MEIYHLILIGSVGNVIISFSAQSKKEAFKFRDSHDGYMFRYLVQIDKDSKQTVLLRNHKLN